MPIKENLYLLPRGFRSGHPHRTPSLLSLYKTTTMEKLLKAATSLSHHYKPSSTTTATSPPLGESPATINSTGQLRLSQLHDGTTFSLSSLDHHEWLNTTAPQLHPPPIHLQTAATRPLGCNPPSGHRHPSSPTQPWSLAPATNSRNQGLWSGTQPAPSLVRHIAASLLKPATRAALLPHNPTQAAPPPQNGISSSFSRSRTARYFPHTHT